MTTLDTGSRLELFADRRLIARMRGLELQLGRPVEAPPARNPAQGRRYTLRTDGFVSLHASADPGEALTRPITFQGERLIVNFATSAAGSLAAEIQDSGGTPIPGLSLADCRPLVGDALEHAVEWKGDPSLARLAGKPVRLKLLLRECDLYSLRFR